MATLRFDLKVLAPAFRVKRGAQKIESGLGTQYVATAVFDSALTDSAGAANTAVGAHGLGVFLPTKAIITNAWVDVVTAFTSSTSAATIALKAESAGDLTAAIAISAGTTPWGLGLKGCVVGSYAETTVAGDTAVLDAARKAGSFVKTTAERELTATVAVEALTAGKAILFVEYTLSA